MKWIALKNNGIFELATALNLLGASVKTTTDPIGMFGSGAKYALAQASRLGMSVKIILGGVVWTMQAKKITFRETEEEVIQFRSESGKIIKTPITKKFGEKDWNDNWFIFREFYSNMMDEQGTMEIVEGIPFCGINETIILLQYAPLAKYADEVSEYFKPRQGLIEVGSGKVYVKGVFAGFSEYLIKLELNLHFENSSYDVLTETRTLKEYDIKRVLSYIMEYQSFFNNFAGTVEILRHIINKREHIAESIDTTANYENWMLAFSRIDDKYLVVGNDEEEKDAIYMGFLPIKFLHGFSSSKSVAQYRNLDSNIYIRLPSANEETLITSNIAKLAFLGSWEGIKFRVITSPTKMGSANMETSIIEVNKALFEDGNEFKLLDTLIHEYGHLASRAKDGERSFVDYFTKQLALLAN